MRPPGVSSEPTGLAQHHQRFPPSHPGTDLDSVLGRVYVLVCDITVNIKKKKKIYCMLHHTFEEDVVIAADKTINKREKHDFCPKRRADKSLLS